MSNGNSAIHEPRRVPASHGWLWLKQGFSMVLDSPVHWIGAILIWLVVDIVLNLLPVISTLSALITPVLMGGVMQGACEQDSGKGFDIERLVAGFSENLQPLLVVGLVYMLGWIVIGLIAWITLGPLLSAATGYLEGNAVLPTEFVPGPLAWLPLLTALMLSVPLLMGVWFAPALVMLDKVPPMNALGMSMAACVKNMWPFLVYGVIGVIPLVVGALLWVAHSFIALVLGFLVLSPAIVASVYTSYRDIFRG